MKVYDFEYLFFRTLRRAKGRYLRACQRGIFSRRKCLRALGIVFLFFCTFTAKPTKTLPVEAVDLTAGEVKGEQATILKEERREGQNSSFSELLTPSPLRTPDSPEMVELTAKAALFVDLPSSAVLYKKNPDLPFPPASTTKIMTALVALKNFSLDDIVAVPAGCLSLPGRKMGLEEGEKITVENLLYGLLVSSASDAACSLSRHKGLTTEEFVNSMNEEARRLGASSTHFSNTVGLDEVDGDHYSTASDLLKITKEALRNETLRRIVATGAINVSSVDKVYWHSLSTTNDLLGTLPGITGVKTGWTEKARGCLVSSYSRGGHEILGVVLGSEDRFGETEAALEWIFRVYRWP